MKKHHQKKAKKYPLIFTFGELDLTLHIDFTDEDLEIKEDKKEDNNQENKEQSGKTKEQIFEDLNELKNLSFLKDNIKTLNRFKIQSKNALLKLFLLGNKNEKQCQIELICFGFPKFEGDETFFKDVLSYITEKNRLKINEKPLNPYENYSIIIEMTYKGKEKIIHLQNKEVDMGHEEDNEIMGEGQSSPNQKIIEECEDEDEDEYGDYEPNEMMKAGYIPKFRRKRSVLCKLCPSSKKYDLIYFSYDDLNKIPGNFKYEDMYELLVFFKKNKSTIFINFYKEEEITKEDDKKGEQNEKNEEPNKQKEEQNKQKEEPNKQKEEPNKQKEEPNKQKEEQNEQKEEPNKQKEEQKEKKINPKIIEINNFYYITDIYFFDQKQAIKSFDEHYKSFTMDDPIRPINSKNVFDYFVKGIATGAREEIPYDKTGLFLDEFNKFFIINVFKKGVNKREFNPQPFPKINTHNIKEVNEYKKNIRENKNELYSLFISEMVSSMGSSAPQCEVPEAIIPSVLTGIDLVKRKVELIKNNIEIDDEEKLFKVKRDPKILAEQIEKLIKGQKEGNFKLDCTNLITSNKKEYVSLFDYHLKNYFSREINRKDLKNKGFIDSNGFIKYDPAYRNAMGTNRAKKKKNNDKDKQDKIINSIKDINIYQRLQDKEISCEKEALNKKDASDIKLPFKEKKKRKKKNIKKPGSKGVGSSIGGSASSGGSSDEENKSGEDNEKVEANQ